MPGKTLIGGGSLRCLLRAVLAWCLTAVVLLAISSALLSRGVLGAGVLGYLSSAVSFLAALAAGIAAARCSGAGRLGVGLRLSLALVLILLTVGFLIAGKDLAPAGILSVVSFTIAGSLVGSVLLGGRQEHGKTTGNGREVRMKSLHKTR